MHHIAIIGAGFTGTMLAVHLMQRAPMPLRVTLIERSARFGQGVAYATRQAVHLLNVPAGRMSAYPDDEQHFVHWAFRHDQRIRGGSFAPRSLYGCYLRDQLRAVRATAAPESRLVQVGAEALSLSRSAGDRLRIVCGGGNVLEADAVVLAVGHCPPADPPCLTPDFYLRDPRYCRNPWLVDASDIDAGADVLMIGTGLTMVDAAATLHAHAHRGRIYAVSRRGLLPQSHRESMIAAAASAPLPGWESWPRTARGLCAAVRAAVTRGAGAGVDWRDVMNSLRSITPALWLSLPQRERRRFLRHLRPFWESHRHRIAPAVGRTIRHLRESGQLQVIAGRVVSYEAAPDIVHAVVRARGTADEVRLRVARVINCTGPDSDLSRVRDPLIRSLREAGMIRADALGLGLDSDEDGHVIDGQGAIQPRLFVAGPLRRGMLWENVAVPELAVEAQRLASLLLARFASPAHAVARESQSSQRKMKPG